MKDTVFCSDDLMVRAPLVSLVFAFHCTARFHIESGAWGWRGVEARGWGGGRGREREVRVEVDVRLAFGPRRSQDLLLQPLGCWPASTAASRLRALHSGAPRAEDGAVPGHGR